MNRYEERLMNSILAASYSKEYSQAKLEWKLAYVCNSEYVCSCGKNPIYNVCFLHNKLTGKYLPVGSTCVNKYLHIDTSKYFETITALTQGKLINDTYTNWLIDTVDLTDWEKNFFLSIRKFHRLSDKQLIVRDKITSKILKQLTDVKEVLKIVENA